MSKAVRWSMVWVLCLLAGWARAESISSFYGDYLGHMEESGENTRDLRVSIHPLADNPQAFNLSWTTVVYRNGRAVSHFQNEASFTATHKPNVFASAMKTNVFGRKIPHDPLQGEPYLWARIKDKTLCVYALIIDEEGTYELQTYERTLTAQGMQLHYVSMSDNVLRRELDATLTKVSP
ncbi:hypothetical protein [Pokkaliibacter plantistimulans]|uniref:hypothetical protein n=1 Tax=Pokkaliibacter plantistimulans TaxID=1635171 RepID=UPI001057D203|nr:hypothetical protein [Pokkaliibacter plantistimulans]